MGLESVHESIASHPGPYYSAQSQLERCKMAEELFKHGEVQDPMKWIGALLIEIERIAQREVDRG